LAKSRIDQVSLECIHSHIPMKVLELLDGKDVLIGVVDVASDVIETPEEIAAVIAAAAEHVRPRHIVPCTNCGMAPMRRDIATRKLESLARGAALARRKFG
jgi:5-methyltetrahydropteroyltriglutamate--homocysteine methyltransferase